MLCDTFGTLMTQWKWRLQITPVNYNLLAVNVAMAATGITQLTRKLRHDYGRDAALEAQQATERLHVSKEA
jgi:Mitochondrial pyruvate carriers